MTRIVVAATLLMTLAACGVDGPPSKPGPPVQTSGEARIGVVGRL